MREAEILAALERAGQTLGFAESLTGGLLCDRFVRIPGASSVVRGAIVAYEDGVKRSLLGVPDVTLQSHGAVSNETAQAMAEGARKALDCDWSVATTGIAGPTGATQGKPVGLCYVAVAGPQGTVVESHAHRGDRRGVQAATCDHAVRLLARLLDPQA